MNSATLKQLALRVLAEMSLSGDYGIFAYVTDMTRADDVCSMRYTIGFAPDIYTRYTEVESPTPEGALVAFRKAAEVLKVVKDQDCLLPSRGSR